MKPLITKSKELIDTTMASVRAGGPFRGEVSFERWYVHYYDKVSAAQVERDPLMAFLPRIWAVASAIESFIKTIITSISIFYYLCLNNRNEIELRVDVMYEQDNSLYYSLFALYSPEKAVDAFTVYRDQNAVKTLTRTRFFGISLGRHSWGTHYRGKTTLPMVFKTH